MRLTIDTNGNYTTRQLKLPLEIEKLIDIADPVYTFCEVMDHIDLSGYFVEKDYKTGRPRCDEQKLLKVILFAFMEQGYSSLREIEKFCRTDIRYMYLLDDNWVSLTKPNIDLFIIISSPSGLKQIPSVIHFLCLLSKTRYPIMPPYISINLIAFSISSTV